MSSQPTAQQKAQSAAQGLINHPVVAGARDSVNQQLSYLDKELGKNQMARDFEAKTKVPKVYGFLALAGTFFLSIFTNIFGLAPIVTNIVGFALPAILSIQALESPSAGDDKQWLTYWVVFSSLTVIESLFLRLVVYYFPYYFVMKTVGIVYLQLPSTRGAIKLYDNVIHPLVAKGKTSPVAPVTTDHEKTL